MIIYKKDEEVELIRQNCLLVCKALEHVATRLKAGISGKVIDQEAEELIRDHGAEPGFKGYRGFPATLCISINEQIVHGIPSNEPFQEGDVVSVDCGVHWNDFYGDAAYTFAIGDVDMEVMELLVTTKECLYLGIEQAVKGNRLGDIGYAVQQNAKKRGYGVVRELVGHGLGKNLHEAPEVPNYGRRGKGLMLKEGLVIAIEPMINLGKRKIRQSEDGWTVFAKDRKPSAHYEHTVVVRAQEADILSNHAGIEEAIKNNENLKEISIKS